MIVINKFFNILDSFILIVNKFFSSIIMRIYINSIGIKTSKGIVFYGLTKFKKGSKNLISIGEKCTFRSSPTSNLIGINKKCIISSIGRNESELIIGDNCGFSGTVIGCFKKIKIGNNVRCGANTLITDSDWHLDDKRSAAPKEIVIEDGVWLGVNVIVLKGVTIGENSVIGAGSVVSKSIPKNVIAAGNPCKVIKVIS